MKPLPRCYSSQQHNKIGAGCLNATYARLLWFSRHQRLRQSRKSYQRRAPAGLQRQVHCKGAVAVSEQPGAVETKLLRSGSHFAGWQSTTAPAFLQQAPYRSKPSSAYQSFGDCQSTQAVQDQYQYRLLYHGPEAAARVLTSAIVKASSVELLRNYLLAFSSQLNEIQVCSMLCRLGKLVRKQPQLWKAGGRLDYAPNTELKLVVSELALRLRDTAHLLSPGSLTGVACALAVLQHYDDVALTRIQQASLGCMTLMSASNLSGLVWALSSFHGRGRPVVSHSWLGEWSTAAAQLAPTFGPLHHARCWHALAVFRHCPGQAWCQHMLATAEPLLPTFNRQDLSNTMWALGRLSVRPGPSFLARFGAATVAFQAELTGQQLGNIAMGMGRLRLLDQQQLLGQLTRASYPRLGSFSPQELNNLGWGLVMLRVPVSKAWKEGFWAQIWRRIRDRPDAIQLAPRTFARLLWTLVRLGHWPGHLSLGTLCKMTAPQLPSFTPQAFATSIWALSALNYVPCDEWLLEFYEQGLMLLPHFRPVDFVQTSVALRRWHTTKSYAVNIHWIDALVNAAAARLPQFSAAESAALLAALSALRYYQPSLQFVLTLLTHFCRTTAAGSAAAPSSALCAVLRSLSTLWQASRDRSWLKSNMWVVQHVVGVLRERLPACSPHELSDCVLSLGNLGYHPGNAWLQLHEQLCEQAVLRAQSAQAAGATTDHSHKFGAPCRLDLYVLQRGYALLEHECESQVLVQAWEQHARQLPAIAEAAQQRKAAEMAALQARRAAQAARREARRRADAKIRTDTMLASQAAETLGRRASHARRQARAAKRRAQHHPGSPAHRDAWREAHQQAMRVTQQAQRAQHEAARRAQALTVHQEQNSTGAAAVQRNWGLLRSRARRGRGLLRRGVTSAWRARPTQGAAPIVLVRDRPGNPLALQEGLPLARPARPRLQWQAGQHGPGRMPVLARQDAPDAPQHPAEEHVSGSARMLGPLQRQPGGQAAEWASVADKQHAQQHDWEAASHGALSRHGLPSVGTPWPVQHGRQTLSNAVMNEGHAAASAHREDLSFKTIHSSPVTQVNGHVLGLHNGKAASNGTAPHLQNVASAAGNGMLHNLVKPHRVWLQHANGAAAGMGAADAYPLGDAAAGPVHAEVARQHLNGHRASGVAVHVPSLHESPHSSKANGTDVFSPLADGGLAHVADLDANGTAVLPPPSDGGPMHVVANSMTVLPTSASGSTGHGRQL